jgi:ABC-type Co2+ transport system permease subunit
MGVVLLSKALEVARSRVQRVDVSALSLSCMLLLIDGVLFMEWTQAGWVAPTLCCQVLWMQPWSPYTRCSNLFIYVFGNPSIHYCVYHATVAGAVSRPLTRPALSAST